jgi:hypothetical protein
VPTNAAPSITSAADMAAWLTTRFTFIRRIVSYADDTLICRDHDRCASLGRVRLRAAKSPGGRAG